MLLRNNKALVHFWIRAFILFWINFLFKHLVNSFSSDFFFIRGRRVTYDFYPLIFSKDEKNLSERLRRTINVRRRREDKFDEVFGKKKWVKIKKLLEHCATLSRLRPQYHDRWRAWLPSSRWNRVFPLRYKHSKSFYSKN